MESSIHNHLDQIGSLCRRYKVRRLVAFGSIVRADFDPRSSDADFLVEFEPVPVTDRMRSYLALRDGLSTLLNCPVDLIEDGAIRNPYILQKVSEQQQVLYAA